jgi:hypothetical protein
MFFIILRSPIKNHQLSLRRRAKANGLSITVYALISAIIISLLGGRTVTPPDASIIVFTVGHEAAATIGPGSYDLACNSSALAISERVPFGLIPRHARAGTDRCLATAAEQRV